MAFLPKLDLDISTKIEEFLTLLRDINTKLDTLIELEQQQGQPVIDHSQPPLDDRQATHQRMKEARRQKRFGGPQ